MKCSSGLCGSAGTAPTVIVGGGPAGCATALSLAARGRRALIIDAEPAGRQGRSRMKVGETLPPDAAIPLEGLKLGTSLEEPEHLHCHGNRFSWGGAQVQESHFFRHVRGHGWHLDRQRFDAHLRERAEQAGQELWAGCRFKALSRKGDSWRILVDLQGQERELEASFLVDATGRAARVARSLGVEREGDRLLIGLAAQLDLASGRHLPQFTHIEATPTGWWYAAPIPGNRLALVFLTDSDLLDRALLEPSQFMAAAQATSMIAPLLEGAHGPAAVHARPASSSRLERVAGRGWLAVGDSAMAYDPVSSHGLTSALGTGLYAGHAITDHLAGRPEALPAYVSILEKSYGAYLEMVQRQYRLERRWSGHPFWRRRQRFRGDQPSNARYNQKLCLGG